MQVGIREKPKGGAAFLALSFNRAELASVALIVLPFICRPWLYLFLIPAIAMRLWAEERRVGTIELLLSLPIPLWSAVLGKFLAAWAFAGISHALVIIPLLPPLRLLA